MKKLSQSRGAAGEIRERNSRRAAGVCRKSQESMKKLSQSRGAAEIAELLFEIFTLNSGKYQKIYWIKCIFLTKRISPRSLRLCVSAKILLPKNLSAFSASLRLRENSSSEESLCDLCVLCVSAKIIFAKNLSAPLREIF